LPKNGARTSADAVTAPAVLVVEDDPAIRALMVATLSEDGFAVEAVTDGAEALAYVRGCRPALIVLDLSMPVMDGREFLRTYRALAGETAPVIVSTALTHPEEEAQRLGAEACLPKPFDLDDLVAMVRRLLPDADGDVKSQLGAVRRVPASAAG
jgi:DNA-binding response OmpR family regulator